MHFDKISYKIYPWKSWMMLHWIFNPGLVINELILGQRVPSLSAKDKTIDKPRSENTLVLVRTATYFTIVQPGHKSLKCGVKKLNANAPIYLYKDNSGLEKYNKVIKWYKDPNELTEKLFFKHHYPCSSFVVIAPNGDFISYFGEFSQKRVFNAIDYVSN